MSDNIQIKAHVVFDDESFTNVDLLTIKRSELLNKDIKIDFKKLIKKIHNYVDKIKTITINDSDCNIYEIYDIDSIMSNRNDKYIIKIKKM